MNSSSSSETDADLRPAGGMSNSTVRGVAAPKCMRWPIETSKGVQPLHRVLLTNLKPASSVALVSISLSIALGIASGATPVHGLTTAAWGGIAGGVFGSSNYNIVGPAGALAAMLNQYATQWGPGILPWISLFSAACCAFCYKFRLQRYLLFMPKSVFEGFTIGVALLIGQPRDSNHFRKAPGPATCSNSACVSLRRP